MRPKRRLPLPPQIPPAPICDPKYNILLKELAVTYDQLCELPSDQLPEGALMVLCAMVRGYNDRYCMDIGVPPPRESLARYGIRVRPAVLHYPAGIEPEGRETSWFYPRTVMVFALLALQWPAPQVEEFFRLAFEAGWNEIGLYLPSEGWGPALWGVFQDSPYGPPRKGAAWLHPQEVRSRINQILPNVRWSRWVGAGQVLAWFGSLVAAPFRGQRRLLNAYRADCSNRSWGNHAYP